MKRLRDKVKEVLLAPVYFLGWSIAIVAAWVKRRETGRPKLSWLERKFAEATAEALFAQATYGKEHTEASRRALLAAIKRRKRWAWWAGYAHVPIPEEILEAAHHILEDKIETR